MAASFAVERIETMRRVPRPPLGHPLGYEPEQLTAITESAQILFEKEEREFWGTISGREITRDMVRQVLLAAEDKNIHYRKKGIVLFDFPICKGSFIGEGGRTITIENYQAEIDTRERSTLDSALKLGRHNRAA